MTGKLHIMTKIYGMLLKLYPSSFRNEFEEQMLLDFSDMVRDIELKRWFPFLLFCVGELVDFPINLLTVHLKHGSMFEILHSQPVNHALRGALGYGVVFGLANLISQFVNLKLFLDGNSIVGNLQVLYFDLFHTEHGLELISWLPNAIASLLTGLLLGILFAALFADRSTYRRYILSGMLGWFLHVAIRDVLWQSANLGFFLGSRHSMYLIITESVLSYTFLGLIFIVAKSEKSEPMRWLVGGSLAYPLISYFYIQLLFKLSIIETPWMFIALMVLMAIYIGSVFVIAFRSDVDRKTIWIIPAVVIAPLLLRPITHWSIYLVSLLIGPINFPYEIPVDSPQFWQLMFRMAVDNAIYGVLLGLIMGMIFGLLSKRTLDKAMSAL